MKILSGRIFNLINFMICAALLAAAFYLEYAKGIQPCPLCLVQRSLFILLTIIFFIAFIHHPNKTGARVYAGSALLVTFLGMLAAGRQIWLQLHPKNTDICMPGLNYMLNNLSLKQTLTMVSQGTDSCSRIDWSFLQLSMADWSFIFFIILALLSMIQIKRA